MQTADDEIRPMTGSAYFSDRERGPRARTEKRFPSGCGEPSTRLSGRESTTAPLARAFPKCAPTAPVLAGRIPPPFGELRGRRFRTCRNICGMTRSPIFSSSSTFSNSVRRPSRSRSRETFTLISGTTTLILMPCRTRRVCRFRRSPLCPQRHCLGTDRRRRRPEAWGAGVAG